MTAAVVISDYQKRLSKADFTDRYIPKWKTTFACFNCNRLFIFILKIEHYLFENFFCG